MSFKRITALLLSLILTVTVLPATVQAKNGAVFELSCSLAEGETPELGDDITYTVALTENSGFVTGTVYFRASDNLKYVSSTLMGNDVEAIRAISGDNIGAWGLKILGYKDDYKETTENFCTMTFKVEGIGNTSAELYFFELVSSSDLINPISTSVLPSNKVSHSVKYPEKPIVTTEKIPDAVLSQSYAYALSADRNDYISWELTSGALPNGLELLNDGTISGVPTEFGEFTVGVTASVSVVDGLNSDESVFKLTVLEKPKKIELFETSKYEINPNGYLVNIVANTKASDFMNNFANKELLKLYDKDGKLVTDQNALIGTGFSVKLADGENVIHSIEVVVLGDVSGDGRLGAVDYRLIKSYCFGIYELEGAFLEAAKITGKDSIGASDYRLLKSHCFGKYDIYK